MVPQAVANHLQVLGEPYLSVSSKPNPFSPTSQEGGSPEAQSSKCLAQAPPR